ncbi:hypothetical protein ACSQ67_018849 [Phaseolus vulgaris]
MRTSMHMGQITSSQSVSISSMRIKLDISISTPTGIGYGYRLQTFDKARVHLDEKNRSCEEQQFIRDRRCFEHYTFEIPRGVVLEDYVIDDSADEFENFTGDEEYGEFRLDEIDDDFSTIDPLRGGIRFRRWLKGDFYIRHRVELQRLAKMASKSHRDRIHEFNQYLANLNQHYDIPKIGSG